MQQKKQNEPKKRKCTQLTWANSHVYNFDLIGVVEDVQVIDVW